MKNFFSKVGAWFKNLGSATNRGLVRLERANARKKPAFWLIIALCLILCGGFFASMVNTNAFRTDIVEFSIPTEDGQWVTGDVFKPKTATASSPAPCVVFVPGFQRTKESHYDIALELARRGIVCFILDPYNQGDSSASLNTSSSSAEGGAYGAIPLVNYLYDTDNVNYIDRDNIGLAGHSAGGNSAMTAAVYFSNLAGGVYENCKVKSVYVSGYIRNIISADVETDEDGNTLFAEVDADGNYVTVDVPDGNGGTVAQRIYTTKENGIVSLAGEGVDWEGSKVMNLSINVGFGYSNVDEGAWQNINLTGDITRQDSYEALALITSGGVHTELRETGLVSGQIYGQPSDGTMKVGYQETCYHGMQPFDVKATSHIMYYFDMVFELDNGINPNSQIWMWKQIFQLVTLVGMFMLIFPVTSLLLEIPFFRSVKQPAGDPKPVPKSAVDWIIFVVTLLLGATCACLSFVPLADLSKIMFVDAAAHKVTWFYPERMNNAILLWAVVNGLFGFLLFFGNRFVRSLIAKRRGAAKVGGAEGGAVADVQPQNVSADAAAEYSSENLNTVGESADNTRTKEKYGFNIGVKNFFKTLLMALMVWMAFYIVVHTVNYLFHIDARFTFVAVRVTNIRYLIYALEYLPFFFIFYLSNSVRVNLSAHTNNGGSGWAKVACYVLAVISNTLGLVAIFAIQYISIAVNGLMYWTTDWLYTNMLWILIPMMFLLPIFQKMIYKKSNNIYLGAMITCLIFITIMMCNSVAHGPFYF